MGSQPSVNVARLQVVRRRSAPVALLAAMRPRHWVKNVIVFGAPMFALRFDRQFLFGVAIAFVAFSLLASATYLLNDVRDASADRLHPVKRLRPIAASELSPATAAAAALALAAMGFGLAAAVNHFLLLVVCIYAMLQVAYTLGLKREPIIDIMCLSAGVVLRAIGGAAAATVPVSGWFLLCLALLALFLAIEKRKAELRTVGSLSRTRAVLAVYSLPWLTRMEGVVTAGAVIAYSLWAIQGAHSAAMLLTVPIVLYAVFKFQLISESGSAEAPERLVLRTPSLIAAVALWLVLTELIFALRGPAIDTSWIRW